MIMMKRKRYHFPLWVILFAFIALNIVANFHAYKFTHFADSAIPKTKDGKHLSFADKLGVALLGVNNPRPVDLVTPTQKFERVVLQSNKSIECWHLRTDSIAKGTVIIFHGYGGSKSSMIDKSDEFLRMGYNTLLVDFMGSGGSEGNQTTVGFFEAQEVRTCYDYLAGTGERHIHLFGTSMGAVAILKALHDYPLQPTSVILECPFGSLYKTTCARFKSLGAPPFPLAVLLVFWGGIQNGFWALGLNPSDYAESVKCPALLLYGEQDEKVSRKETDEIFANMKGFKQLKTYPLAGHENFLSKYHDEWVKDVGRFLETGK